MNKSKFFALSAAVLMAAGLAFFQVKANSGACCSPSPDCCDMSAGTCDGQPCTSESACCPIPDCPLPGCEK